MGTQPDFLVGLVNTMGDVDFDSVYRTELPRIYNFFRYRVGDDQIAEDLTAETFEKAWKHRARYRHDLASFSTWLFSIARRIATDYFRKQRPSLPLEAAAQLADPQVLEEQAQEQADFAHVSRLLARLADRERELVALKYGAGLTNRAIARISGLSESNVSTILHRLTSQLRAQLENTHE
jgi:RNA polymerase sigma-70 factor (ECF subfamily)